MSRYIDAEKITDIIKMDIKQCEVDVSESCGDEMYEMAVHSRSNAMYSILREVENAPTADVVEVVRCEDCRHSKVIFEGLTDSWHCKKAYGFPNVDPKGFCSHGERYEK